MRKRRIVVVAPLPGGANCGRPDNLPPRSRRDARALKNAGRVEPNARPSSPSQLEVPEDHSRVEVPTRETGASPPENAHVGRNAAIGHPRQVVGTSFRSSADLSAQAIPPSAKVERPRSGSGGAPRDRRAGRAADAITYGELTARAEATRPSGSRSRRSPAQRRRGGDPLSPWRGERTQSPALYGARRRIFGVSKCGQAHERSV